MTSSRDIAVALDGLLAAFQLMGTSRRGQLGLSANEEATLLLVGQGVTAPSELSRAIGITTAGMTNLLDRFEASKLIRREPHAVDKRRVLVTLTKQGYRAQLELEAVQHEVAGWVLEHGSGTEIHRFLTEAAAIVRREAGER